MAAKSSTIQFYIKIVIAVFVITTATFASFTYVYYQDSQQKAGVIKVQIENIEGKIKVIENQSQKISFLGVTIENQSLQITSLNSTVLGQKDTIERQILELRRRSDTIGLLEGNVSLLKGEVQKRVEEIVSLTPVTKNYFVAAVKSDGEGVIIPLDVKILPKGSGLLSVNIKNVDLQSGAQESIRMAAAIAGKLAAMSISDRDIDVSFVNQLADIVTVDGPSAGGAITATVYAALTQKSISSNVLTTGTIEADGTIGSVGGIAKKAEAAKNQGASKFLVPKGQKVSVSGIEVIEVGTIQDILNQAVG